MGADEDGNQVIRVMIMRMSKMIMRRYKMVMRRSKMVMRRSKMIMRSSKMIMWRSKMIRVVVVMVNNMRMRSVIRWPNHRLGKI